MKVSAHICECGCHQDNHNSSTPWYGDDFTPSYYYTGSCNACKRCEQYKERKK